MVFNVCELVIAYIMQQKGIRDCGISRNTWHKLFKGNFDSRDILMVRAIKDRLKEEKTEAERIKEIVEKTWRLHEKYVLNWLKEIVKVDFRLPEVRVSVVPFGAGQTPFRDVPLIVVGKIREGWGYPETLAHELAHVLFNQNFDFENEVEHPYIQLIEEEIAVRLGARPRYFSYEIPGFAGWVKKAQQKEKAWKVYLQSLDRFRDISEFIEENEKCNFSPR